MKASPTRSAAGRSPTSGAGSTTPAASVRDVLLQSSRRAENGEAEQSEGDGEHRCRCDDGQPKAAHPRAAAAGRGEAKGLGQELAQAEHECETENRRDEGERDAPPRLAGRGVAGAQSERVDDRALTDADALEDLLLLRGCRRQRDNAQIEAGRRAGKRRAHGSGAEGRSSPPRDRRRAGLCPTRPRARVQYGRHAVRSRSASRR